MLLAPVSGAAALPSTRGGLERGHGSFSSPNTPESCSGCSEPSLVLPPALLVAISAAVDKVIAHFSSARNLVQKAQLGDSRLSPDVGYLLLHTLCPALYALVEDGLKPFQKDVITGQRRNSPWSVVEASVRTGPCGAPGAGSTSRSLEPFPTRSGDCCVFHRPRCALLPLAVWACGRSGPTPQHQAEVSCLYSGPFEVSSSPSGPCCRLGQSQEL
uniref:Uncharacterized protein n=1 Tax=Melopsittacus undulatus TaxID=13146 RepID=A0A8V5GZI8_MELUD